jgi:cytochrome c biogenesis protein CcmG, thiol:disulfide interchange protein DsbE
MESTEAQDTSTGGPTLKEGGVRPSRRPLLRRLLQSTALAAVAGLLALLVWRVVHSGSGSAVVRAVSRGEKPNAPAFNLPVIWSHSETWPATLHKALVDGRIDLRELRGHPVVINFWASWCIPCKREAPRFTAAARTYAGKVAFLGIDIQDFVSDAHRFLRRYETNYVSVRNGDGSVGNRYGITGIPETYYLNRRGRIVVHDLGEASPDDLQAGIGAILRRR